MGSSTARPWSGLFAAVGASACRVALLLPSLAFASSPCPGEARDPALPWPWLSACAVGWGHPYRKGDGGAQIAPYARTSGLRVP